MLTAARAWTGQPTPSGAPLAGLAALWIAARAFNYFGPSSAALLADAAFLVLPMIALGIVLVRAGSHRNLFVLVVLTAFLIANTLFHLAVAARVAFAPMTAVHFFVFTVVMLTGVIGGRVIPSFTASTISLSAMPVRLAACACSSHSRCGAPPLTARDSRSSASTVVRPQVPSGVIPTFR